MIAKGNLHGDGVNLVKYLLTGARDERAEFGGTLGFEDYRPDLREAVAFMQHFAEVTTRAELPWFHTQTRLAPGERLNQEQWELVFEREEQRLGFVGLPRAWAYHIFEATGEKHGHCMWFRVDADTARVRDPGLFKRRLMEVAREIELEFGLQLVGNKRRSEARASVAERTEIEEARRLGTNIAAIRNTIIECLEQANDGRSFKSGLRRNGLMLANGDRRNCFLVIDAAGGQHALIKRFTGLTLEELRKKISDLDRFDLPNVKQAQLRQRISKTQLELKIPLAPDDRGPNNCGKSAPIGIANPIAALANVQHEPPLNLMGDDAHDNEKMNIKAHGRCLLAKDGQAPIVQSDTSEIERQRVSPTGDSQEVQEIQQPVLRRKHGGRTPRR
jgi:hypothetical protein